MYRLSIAVATEPMDMPLPYIGYSQLKFIPQMMRVNSSVQSTVLLQMDATMPEMTYHMDR